MSRLHVLCEICCLLLFCVNTLEEVLIEESSSIESLLAPRDRSVELPCDVTPALADDRMALVIWYKQGHDAPIYSFDNRDGVTSHWSDPTILGPRATFRGSSAPAALVITRLRAEDSGQYRCRVDFSKSPTKNTRLNLTVLIPPERLMILNQEGDEVRGGVLGPYDEHTNVTLTCLAVGGRPPARVSWWKSHALLANSETRATVSLQLTRSDYGDNITCQAVTDPSLTPDLSETLSIDMNLHLLWLRLLGGKRPLVAGQSTELVCQAAGARPKPNISWWKGGVRLTNVRETISPDGNVSSSILTLVPSIDDAGRVLSCRAQQPTIPHSMREDGWKLEIQHIPVVKLKLGANLDAKMIVEGSDVYLDCMVKANPWHTHVYFTHNGAIVKPGPGVLLANQSLVLQHVSRRTAGAYVCAARSALGEGASNTFMLDVKYSPSCKSQQASEVRAARGESVDLHCDLNANPQEPMSYVWWFNSSTHDKYELAVPTVNTHHPRSYSYIVNSSSSYGWVQCAGTNSVGRQAAPCVFNILPAEKPSAVSGCSLTNVTHSSVSVTCASGYDGGLRQAFILHVYDLDTGVLLRNISSSEPHFMVWGLADRSGVRLTVRAVNKQGDSEPVTLITSLLNNSYEQTALAPVSVKLSPVLLLVLCAGAVLVTITALVVVLMCTRYFKRHDDKDKVKREKEVTLNKPHTEYEDCENDKNPDIIPIESKINDTCSNMLSTTDLSSVRPLLSRTNVDKYDELVNDERYFDNYACNMQKTSIGYRRQYQPILQMHGPSIPNIRPNVQSAGPSVSHLLNIRPEEYQLPHDQLYEDWLRYENSVPHNTGLQFLPPSAIPPPSLYAQPRPLRLVDMPDPNYRIELPTDLPLSADTTVYYYRNPHERDNKLPPHIPPVSTTTEFTNTTSDTGEA